MFVVNTCDWETRKKKLRFSTNFCVTFISRNLLKWVETVSGNLSAMPSCCSSEGKSIYPVYIYIFSGSGTHCDCCGPAMSCDLASDFFKLLKLCFRNSFWFLQLLYRPPTFMSSFNDSVDSTDRPTPGYCLISSLANCEVPAKPVPPNPPDNVCKKRSNLLHQPDLGFSRHAGDDSLIRVLDTYLMVYSEEYSEVTRHYVSLDASPRLNPAKPFCPAWGGGAECTREAD